jgi:hypothetical protein
MADDLTTWALSAATFLIGYGTKALSELLQHRRTRAREAREDARRDQIVERRTTFQRQTLLELQDACMDLVRGTGAAHHHDRMAFRKSGKRQLLPDDVDQALLVAQMRTTKLVVRVRDDTARELVEKFKSYASEVGGAKTPQDSDQGMAAAAATFDELNRRIGQLLREIDDAEQIGSNRLG